MRHRSGMGLAMLGSAMGPFIGVTLSLVAVRNAQTGVAATIMAISPIILIPASAVIHKERITWRAVGGAVLAIGGVAMLFLHPIGAGQSGWFGAVVGWLVASLDLEALSSA